MNQVAASPEAASGPLKPINSSGIATAQTAATKTQFISFAISDEQYGVDIMAVREIKGWSEITRLPNQPDYVRGVLNLRGVIVPIIDLRCRFGQGLTETTPLHIVIIVQIDGSQVGLIGDRVLDIVSVDTAQIQPVPRTSRGISAQFLSGLATHDNDLIALINLQNLLNDAEDAAASTAPPARVEGTA
jgi:purine-binding chemotaxis protein CheW